MLTTLLRDRSTSIPPGNPPIPVPIPVRIPTPPGFNLTFVRNFLSPFVS